MLLARASARRVAGKNQPPRRPHIGPFPRRRHENPRLGFTRAPARRSQTLDEPSSPKVRLPSSRRGRRRVVHPAHVLTESSHARPTPAIHRHASSHVHPFVRPRSTPPTASGVRVGVSLDDERAHECIHDADRAPRESAQTPRFPRPRGPIARDVRRRVRGRHRASRARASRTTAARAMDSMDSTRDSIRFDSPSHPPITTHRLLVSRVTTHTHGGTPGRPRRRASRRQRAPRRHVVVLAPSRDRRRLVRGLSRRRVHRRRAPERAARSAARCARGARRRGDAPLRRAGRRAHVVRRRAIGGDDRTGDEG